MVEQGSEIAEKAMVVLSSMAGAEKGRRQRVAGEGEGVCGVDFVAEGCY